MHSERNPGSCFDKNYNPVSLKVWEANLDIKYVGNYYKPLICMATYIFKVRKCKADKKPKGKCLQWKSSIFIYYKYTPTVCTMSTVCTVCYTENLPENNIRMIKSKEEFEVLSDDSTDIFKWNIINRYMDCPKCGDFFFYTSSLQGITIQQYKNKNF